MRMQVGRRPAAVDATVASATGGERGASEDCGRVSVLALGPAGAGLCRCAPSPYGGMVGLCRGCAELSPTQAAIGERM